MNKTFYFAKLSHFGAIDKRRGADRFFSPLQYFDNFVLLCSFYVSPNEI